jgi:outer membrane protein OmpA-like peptidoglycan-associated protein
MKMKCLILTLTIGGLLTGTVAGQDSSQSNAVININVSRTIQTVNYWARGSTKVDFIGTALMPRASGEAKVESKSGALAIEAQFKDLQAPDSFGVPFLVYVLWAITPEGRVANLGQLEVKDGKGKMSVTTKLQTFGLIVTAEPYFAVTYPSDQVVLENKVRSDTRGAVNPVDAKFELLQRGRYGANLPSIQMDGKTPLDLYQARNAVNIAKSQGAEQYAPEAFAKATAALAQAEDYQKRKQRNAVPTAARNAVQAAEDARSISVRRQQEEKLASEKKAAADAEAAARAAQEEEAKRRAHAEVAAAQASAAQAQAEASAAKDAQARAQAEAARVQAEAARAQAEAQQKQAMDEAAQQSEAAARAEKEKQELRARLLEQFNRVLPTTDSPRGLVVNMGDVLFDTGKADLRQPAREALAKLSGIVLNYPTLHLTIEGHTDSTGTEEFNQKLSERRAQNVRDYLVSQGLAADSLTSQGFGQANPVADNKTAAGRQKNRRVEIVVSGEVIGTKIGQ